MSTFLPWTHKRNYVLQHIVDRHGSVRCECTVEDGGVRYAGKVYRSLSAAAMAAAKDLGLTNRTQNLWCGPSYVAHGPSEPRFSSERMTGYST